MVFTKWQLFSLLLVSCLFISCQDKLLEHYEKPDWMSGNIWETLETNSGLGGNYSIFLKGAELAGFRPYLEGKGVLTVLAPNDEAFADFLTTRGYESVEEMASSDLDELKKVIGFHLLYYSYTKQMMENYRPEGQQFGESLINRGMYYKFRTRSASPVTQAFDKVNNRTVDVYHLERFIPVFSPHFFATKKIDAKENYEFFYPNSTWNGGEGFNVSGASVENYEIIANNGYVYTVDRVIEPLETIYEEMKSNPEFTEFAALYDAYSYYEYDPTLSIEYGPTVGVDSLFLHKHWEPMPPIALEWPVSDYSMLHTLASISYSVFAPTNKALNTFFSTYWANSGYESLHDVDPLIVSLLLNEYVYGGSVVFPEEIVSGSIVSNFGSAYNFDPYKATYRKMCVNGSFYGFDEIEGPELFNSVIGPSFQRSDRLNFLYALNSSGSLYSFGADQTYTLLIPDNDAFHASGYSLITNEQETYLAEETDDGLVAVNSATLRNIVNAHTMVGEADFHASGSQVLANVMPYNYWYVKDGQITCSSKFNSILAPGALSPFVPFQEVTNHGQPWSNGKTYTYRSALGLFESIFEVDGLKKTLASNNDNRYPYFAFAQLLRRAGLVSGEDILGIAGRFIAFIPSNEAIYAALANDEIPGITGGALGPNGEWTGTVDTEVLKNYLYRYFIVASQIPTCPFPGSEMVSGEYTTYAMGQSLVYTDTGSSLRVRLKGSSKECPVSAQYDYFPFAYSDGSFHFIDSIL